MIKPNRPPTDLHLKPGDLHLWITALEHASNDIEHFKHALSPEERRRAQQFKVEKTHLQFVASRGILKELLARYLHIPAHEVHLNYGIQGKPKLSESLQRLCPDLAFNLSHSHGHILYGITSATALGVDIEYRNRDRPFDALAQHFFSATEVQEIQQARGLDKKIRFYNIWTKKEALLKALGIGLYGSLKQFSVSGEHDDSLTHLAFDSNSHTWEVFSLDYDRHFSLAVAMNHPPQSICFWTWENDSLNKPMHGKPDDSRENRQ